MSSLSTGDCWSPAPDAGHCPLCSDAGVAARVVALCPEQALASVEANGERHEVAVDLLDQVAVGDALQVHLGFAIARLEEGR